MASRCSASAICHNSNVAAGGEPFDTRIAMQPQPTSEDGLRARIWRCAAAASWIRRCDWRHVSAECRATEPCRTSGRRDDPSSAVAGLRDAETAAAAERTELAVTVNPAIERTAAHHDMSVFANVTIGGGQARPETCRQQKNHRSHLTHCAHPRRHWASP